MFSHGGFGVGRRGQVFCVIITKAVTNTQWKIIKQVMFVKHSCHPLDAGFLRTEQKVYLD